MTHHNLLPLSVACAALAGALALSQCDPSRAQQMGVGIAPAPTGWSILATACMEATPTDCWSWLSPKQYPSLADCQAILAEPWVHGYTDVYPLKVEGSRWIFEPACVGTLR